jgi:hypothetical protein
MKTVNLQQHDFAIISAYRNMLIDASKMTLDDRPKELKEFDRKSGVSDPSQFTPYRYTDADNKKRNLDLRAFLLCNQFGVAYLHCREFINEDDYNFCSQSDEFFVMNVNDDPSFYDTISALSECFNQEHYFYGDVKRGALYLVVTKEKNEDEVNKLSDFEGELEVNVLEDYEEPTIMNMMTAYSVIKKRIMETGKAEVKL